MTKEKFSLQLAKELKTLGLKINSKNAEKLILAISESMNEGLANDRKLVISNFGSFEVVKYGAKIINSPRGDSKKFFMPPTDVIKWHPSGKIRERAETETVTEEEYKELLGSPIAETEETFRPRDKNEVPIKIISRKKNHFSDKNSPISKLFSSIISQMSKLEAKKIEVVPKNDSVEIIFTNDQNILGQIVLPKESHLALVEKVDLITDSNNKFFDINNQRFKTQKKLSPFGYQIIILKNEN